LPLLQVAMKWKKLVWITVVTIIVPACVVALLLPNHYTATVVLLPPQQGGPAGAAMMAQLSNLGAMASAAGNLGIKNPNDQQVALLKSRTVEDAMVARFHLQAVYHRKYLSTTRKRWERATKIDNGLKDGLMRLSVTDWDPRRAADLANGWVEEYRRLTATLAITEASQRRLFFERELSAAHEDLVRAEENMKQTEQRTGVIEIEGQSRAMIASAAMLRGQLAAKQVEIRAMREFAANQNPDLVRAQQEAAGMEGQLAAMDAASDRSTGDLITPKGTVTQAGLDYTRALREVKYRETIQDLLTRQYEGARVDEARQGVQVQIVDPAVVPDRPSSHYRLWILLGAILAALPLALLAARAAEALAIALSMRRRCGSWSGMLEADWSKASQ
jgi:capsule polysaccharide export protein KpsE/RkpR